MKNTNEVPLEDALSIAQHHHVTGNLTLADRTYRDILKVVPDNYTSLHYLGVLAYQRGAPEEGLDFIKKAVKIESDKHESWNIYAVMLAQIGEKEKALEIWEKALDLKPDFVEALSNVGHALWELGRNEEARETCEKAIKANPRFIGSYINLGNALMALGKNDEAIEIWQKAIQLDPRDYNSRINIGNALRDIGRVKESEDYCRKALELSRDHPDALLNLANALHDQGLYEEAEKFYRKSTEIRPDHAGTHNNLAVTLMKLLRLEEAAAAARYAIAFQPDYAEAYSNLAATLREIGKLEEAEETARKAILLSPDSAEVRIELADILFMSDRLDEAETLLNDAAELKPDNPRLYIKLNAVLERANRTEDALKAIDKAVELNPEMPEAYHRQAITYFMANQIENALNSLDKLLKINPDFSPALATRAEILQAYGDMDEALEFARKGLELNNNLPFLHYVLSKLKKFTDKNDPDLKAMKEIAETSSNFGRAHKIPLQFALFKAHEDIGDYETAFEYLQKACDLKRACSVFDRDTQEMAHQNVRQTYSKEFIESFKDQGSASNVPIFIIGMPRSGTTLTEQVISSHPDVFGGGELYYLSEIEHSYGMVSPERCKIMGDEYVKHIRSINQDSKAAKKITDKMPGNYMRLGQIVTTLPNAKVIHCRRNPMDTCLSCYKQLFARGHYWSYNLEEMAEHYELYEQMMAHWRDVLPTDAFLEIDYEKTVNDFENQARKLIDFVEMEWNDACLTPHKTKRSILTASKAQVRKPVYKTSVEAWKRYEKQLKPLADKLKKFVR